MGNETFYWDGLSPFFTTKSMMKIIFPFHFRGFYRATRTTPGSAPGCCFLNELSLSRRRGRGGGGGSHLRIPVRLLQESRISLSFHIDIPHPVPNFSESRFPGVAKSRIPHRILLRKSRIPKIPNLQCSRLISFAAGSSLPRQRK